MIYYQHCWFLGLILARDSYSALLLGWFSNPAVYIFFISVLVVPYLIEKTFYRIKVKTNFIWKTDSNIELYHQFSAHAVCCISSEWWILSNNAVPRQSYCSFFYQCFCAACLEISKRHIIKTWLDSLKSHNRIS